MLKREVEKSMQEIREKEMSHIKVPSMLYMSNLVTVHVQWSHFFTFRRTYWMRGTMNAIDKESFLFSGSCHQNHRNRMREYLISWMSLTVTKQQWYTKVYTYNNTWNSILYRAAIDFTYFPLSLLKAYNCAGLDDASLNCSSWISNSGLIGRRRTYLTILKRAWSANFKMVWYILLRPLRPELDGRPSFSWSNLRKHHQNQHNCRSLTGDMLTKSVAAGKMQKKQSVRLSRILLCNWLGSIMALGSSAPAIARASVPVYSVVA
jgi:hypothetical protein